MSELRVVKVRERWRGTHGGLYVYVVERNILTHISEYSSKSTRSYHDEVIYEVPLQRVLGKNIYCFDFSKKGGAFIAKCKIEDFDEEGRLRSYEYFDILEERIDEIQHLEFKIKSSTLVNLISDFNKYFIPMIQELKEYGREKGFEYWFMGHQERLKEVFTNYKLYYFTSMSLPSDEKRIMSLRVTRRWVYELWVLKLICQCLQVSRFTHHIYEGKPFWWIEQGSEFSTCIGETLYGEATFWLEFQPSKYAHMWGAYEGYREGLARVAPSGKVPRAERMHMMKAFSDKRVAVRPDIVATLGHYERTEDFINSGKTIDLLVECKEDPFEKWADDVKSQIIPYLEYFKPKQFILASLKPVPPSIKSYLEDKGIKVVDNLKPGSENINILCDLVHKAFT